MVGSHAFRGDYPFLNRGIIQRTLKDYIPKKQEQTRQQEKSFSNKGRDEKALSTMRL